MPPPLLISSQSDYLIQVFDRNSHTEWQTVQIQISELSEANWSGSTLFAKAGYIRGFNYHTNYHRMCNARKRPLCNLGTMQALIRLCKCTGWSGLHCLLTDSMDTVVHVDEQRMSRSDCMNEHADLDLSCLHMAYRSLSHVVQNIIWSYVN